MRIFFVTNVITVQEKTSCLQIFIEISMTHIFKLGNSRGRNRICFSIISKLSLN